MNTHLNAIRTVALICIAGKAVSVSFAGAEGGLSLSATVNTLLINFLLLAALLYFSAEFALRFFIWPQAQSLHAIAIFRKNKAKAIEQVVDKEPEPEPTKQMSPLETPKAKEVIAYTLGTFAGVLTNEELMALVNNLKGNDFRTYILKIRVKQSGKIISRNSAAGYWSTFRALLKLAHKEGWLRENINDHLDRIDWEEPKINYLEIEEVKRLAATHCKVDVLKRASLFACMTGLRISDILQLRWENIELSPDGGYCMRIRTQKTKTQATLPLSDEALSYCGEHGRGMVFKGLSRAHTREPFKKWLKDAGIKKKITFHGLRHTYATLLISNGTDIYTVSKMLTHKNVATTQIYADVVNQKKRDAANSISLK